MNSNAESPLVVFEMANNHMGSLEHGLRIIREMHAVCRDFSFRFGFKLQYRDLDTLIHPAYRNRNDLKYVKRFSETRLERGQFLELKQAAADMGFVTICTPFDEASVGLIEAHGFDIIKIASCSFLDWPLLERIAASHKPIIASVAGVALEDIDKVVSFFQHREKDLTLLHCVAEYPTANANLQLNQIDLLRERYRGVPIGYSTHEDPEETQSVMLALAKGARVVEKHVGVPTEKWPLNAYSANPQQVARWLEAATTALQLCGISGKRAEFSGGETASLRSLGRGAFAKRPIAAGSYITPADVLLAIPTLDGQLTAKDISKYRQHVAKKDIPAEAPLLAADVESIDLREKVYAIVCRVRDLLRQSGVVLPAQVDLEISHHYGIDRFDEFGLTMLTAVNRGYCKKILVLLPGQIHPEQYHKVKEESFHVLYGDIWINLDGHVRDCKPGDVVVAEPGARHSFGTKGGAVLEEVSLTHTIEDSFYTDPAIGANEHRKSLLRYWLG
jgi:sialic acid synthase SpsE/mannose-6-phosphate isomerase-like protein (cupin superfamily)